MMLVLAFVPENNIVYITFDLLYEDTLDDLAQIKDYFKNTYARGR